MHGQMHSLYQCVVSQPPFPEGNLFCGTGAAIRGGRAGSPSQTVPSHVGLIRRLGPAEALTAIAAFDRLRPDQFGSVGTVLHLAAIDRSLLKDRHILWDDERQDETQRAQQETQHKPAAPAAPFGIGDHRADNAGQQPDYGDRGTND